MKKILIIISILFCAGSIQSLAQSTSSVTGMFNISWDINAPLNNKQFISEWSLPGGKLESRWFIKPNLSFGIGLEWFSMYEYQPKQTYSFGSIDVTTDTYKYLYMVPVTASLHYYPITGGKALPFIGLSTGAAYAEPSVYFNIYQLSDDNWGFTFKPEIGTVVPLGGSDWGLLLGVGYNYYTNSFSEFKLDNIQTFNINIGLSILR